MHFIWEIHNTNNSVNSYCLYYRYFDFIAYGTGFMLSIFFMNLIAVAIGTLICSMSYFLKRRIVDDDLHNDICVVMGVIHGVLSFMLFVIFFII